MNPQSRSIVSSHPQDGLAPAASSGAKPPARLALATALLNLSVSASSSPLVADAAPQAVSAGAELLLNADAAGADEDAAFRCLVALATFALASVEVKALERDLGLDDVAKAMKARGGKVGDAAKDLEKALAR